MFLSSAENKVFFENEHGDKKKKLSKYQIEELKSKNEFE
jgi:hypothetical protein